MLSKPMKDTKHQLRKYKTKTKESKVSDIVSTHHAKSERKEGIVRWIRVNQSVRWVVVHQG
jgi:hypothetical protein